MKPSNKACASSSLAASSDSPPSSLPIFSSSLHRRPVFSSSLHRRPSLPPSIHRSAGPFSSSPHPQLRRPLLLHPPSNWWFLIGPFEQRFDPESVRRAFVVVAKRWQQRYDVAIEQRDKAREEGHQHMLKCAESQLDVLSYQWRVEMLRGQLADEKEKNAALQLKLQDAEQKLAKM